MQRTNWSLPFPEEEAEGRVPCPLQRHGHPAFEAALDLSYVVPSLDPLDRGKVVPWDLPVWAPQGPENGEACQVSYAGPALLLGPLDLVV